MTPNQADEPCADSGPEVVDRGDSCRVESAEASEVFEPGVCLASLAAGFFEPSPFVAFRPAICAFGNQLRRGPG